MDIITAILGRTIIAKYIILTGKVQLSMLQLMSLTTDESINAGIIAFTGLIMILTIVFTKKIYRKYIAGVSSLFLCLLVWILYPVWFQWWGLLLFVAVISVFFLQIHMKEFYVNRKSEPVSKISPSAWETLEKTPQSQEKEEK